MSDDIVIQNDFLAPVVDVETAMERYRMVNEFIKRVLKEGVDYGGIPGYDKPVLLKPGAEKMCTFFGLTPRIIEREAVEDWTGEKHGGEPFFYYRYRIGLYRNERLVAEGEGSANSWETKYRYRSAERICPVCGKPTIIKGKAEYGGGYVCFTKKGGCGAKFADDAPEIIGQPVGTVKHPNPADIVNTLQKIAQKRGLIPPVLLATNTSEYFTQDFDDFADAGRDIDSKEMSVEEAKRVLVTTASGTHRMSDFAGDPKRLETILTNARDATVRQAAEILLKEYQGSEGSE